MENSNQNADVLPVLEVNSIDEHINNGADEKGGNSDDAMSDDTLPGDVQNSIDELQIQPSLNMKLPPSNKAMEADRTFDEQAPSPPGEALENVVNSRRNRPAPRRSKPGPKSSKRPMPKRITASDRKHTALISLGPYRHINVCIEISGVDGLFSRIDGEVVFTVPVKSTGSTKNQWKLADILREVVSASSSRVPVDDPIDPYGPLLNDADDVDPPSSPESSEPRAKYPRKSARTQNYDCLDCQMNFKRKSDLTVHQRNGLCPALAGPFLCDECGLTLNTNAEIKKHRKTHNRALCHLCGKTFPVGHCMKQHMITHAGYKPFDCQYCGAQFRSKTARSLHESTHKEERPHICQMCAASFKRIGLLKRHIKFVHNQEAKDVRCKTCGRGFRSKSDLNAHLPSHTGEKRYCCDQCGKRFAYKVCLSDHVKTVHSDVRAYKCSECDKAFKTSSMLASHRRSHTKQAAAYAPPKHTKANRNETVSMSDYMNQRPVSQSSDFTQYPQRYMPQVGEYNSMQQNVFSPLRYLDLTGPGQASQKPNVSQVYRDPM